MKAILLVILGLNSANLTLLASGIDQAPVTSTQQKPRLDTRIPAPDRERYRSIRDAKDWMNPKLTILRSGVEVVAKGRTVAIAAGDLRKTLVGLPVEAWPYGRVASVALMHLRSVGGGDDYPIEQNRQAAKRILEELEIEINWWP